MRGMQMSAIDNGRMEDHASQIVSVSRECWMNERKKLTSVSRFTLACARLKLLVFILFFRNLFNYIVSFLSPKPHSLQRSRGTRKTEAESWLKCNQTECNLALADCNTKSHNLPDRKGVHAREPTHFKLFKKSSISALACLLSNRISLLRKKWDGFIKCCVSFVFKVVRKKPSFQLNSPFI